MHYCVWVWGNSVRCCFRACHSRIVPSRSCDSRACFFFDAASNKPTFNIVVVADGKANTKLVPLAVLSTSRHRCRCVAWLNVTASPPLPHAVAPFCEWISLMFVCEWRRFSFSACANTLTQTHTHTYTYMCTLSDVWVFSWMEFEFGVLFSVAAAYQTHTRTYICRLTNTDAN